MYGEHELKVNVEKDKLLEILKANREKHAKDYDYAKTGFRKLLIIELQKKLKSAKEGKKVVLIFKNQKPTNHLKDYDEIIGMLELSTDKELKLNQQQYKQYVNNEWNWVKHWSTSNSAYIGAALSKD